MIARHLSSLPRPVTVTREPLGRRRRVLVAASRVAHDLGLAAWFGGAAMGAIGLNSATREVDEPTQRLRVANAGWFRWAPLTGMAISAHLAGTYGRSRWGHAPALVGHGDARAIGRLLLTGLALGATIESGRAGRRVVSRGDVPAATAVTPIADTPDDVAAAMRRLRIVQWIIPLATAGILGINALQDRTD